MSGVHHPAQHELDVRAGGPGMQCMNTFELPWWLCCQTKETLNQLLQSCEAFRPGCLCWRRSCGNLSVQLSRPITPKDLNHPAKVVLSSLGELPLLRVYIVHVAFRSSLNLASTSWRLRRVLGCPSNFSTSQKATSSRWEAWQYRECCSFVTELPELHNHRDRLRWPHDTVSNSLVCMRGGTNCNVLSAFIGICTLVWPSY